MGWAGDGHRVLDVRESLDSTHETNTARYVNELKSSFYFLIDELILERKRERTGGEPQRETRTPARQGA